MNQAEPRAEHIETALKAAGWGLVREAAYDEGFVIRRQIRSFAANTSISATTHLTGLKGLEEYQTHFH